LRPIELNPRAGGGSINDLVFAVHTVDLRGLGTKIVLDRVSKGRCFVTVVVQPDRAGRIKRYCGVNRVPQQLGCVFGRKLVPEGSVVEGLDRESYLIEFCVVGDDIERARSRASELLSWISVDMGQEPEPVTSCWAYEA